MSQSYAGLWVRIKAFAADYLIISIYIIALIGIGIAIQSIFPDWIQTLFGDPISGQISGFFVITLPVTLYFALFESSPHQATWGKRWQGIMVTGKNGTKLSAVRSFGRTALKFVPWELSHTCIWQIQYGSNEHIPIITSGFVLVWLLVGLYALTLVMSSKRQTLYDSLTNTVVIRNVSTS